MEMKGPRVKKGYERKQENARSRSEYALFFHSDLWDSIRPFLVLCLSSLLLQSRQGLLLFNTT